MTDTTIRDEKADKKAKESIFFSPKATIVLTDWWKSLEDNKGLRASLRRATSPTNVLFESKFYTLHNALLAARKEDDKDKNNKTIGFNDESLATVMGLLAHIKHPIESKKMFGAVLGSADADKSGNARLSEARFKRLLLTEDREEMYRSMIRILRLLDGKVPIPDFANIVYWWNDRTKRELAKEYYKALTKFNADDDNDNAPTGDTTTN